MGWTPRWRHVSQLYRHAGDPPGLIEGDNDCFEASLARYLRETGYWFESSDDRDLVAFLRMRVTGQPDHAGRGFTSLQQATAGLQELGIEARWTTSLPEALAAPWAILWVRASRLRLLDPVAVDGAPQWTAYPLPWLAGEGPDPDHFILKLPSDLFNDPLAYYCGDCRYSPTSLAGAFGGAWCLLTPAHTASRGPGGSGHLVVVSGAGLHLREAPTLEARVLLTLPDGERVADAYASDCLWRFVVARGQHGWVRRDYVQEVR